MKNLVIIMIIFWSIVGQSQVGCTDVNANNYNSNATQNDGSCTYNPTNQVATEIGLLTPAVPESSGIIYENGFIYTHGDSGNPSKFYKIDASSGALLQKITVTNFNNDDWEEITSDNDYFYIGDFGNNTGVRTNLKVLKISKSQFINSTDANVNVTAEAIYFSYTDQTSFVSNQLNNFDCESMISFGNFLYLFTKNRGDGQTKVYKLSKTPGIYSLNILSVYSVNGLLSGASYNQNTNEIALLGYLPPTAKNGFIIYLNDFVNDQFFTGNVRRVEIGNTTDSWQTEGICYKNDSELFLSCETTSFTNAKLYLTSKPISILSNDNFVENEFINICPNPVIDSFSIASKSTIDTIEIYSIEGKLVYQSTINQRNFIVEKSLFSTSTGLYILKMNINNTFIFRKIFVK